MFNCQRCGHTTQPREKQTKVTVEIRLRKDGSSEIVREINICPQCVEGEKESPQQPLVVKEHPTTNS